MQNLIVAVSAVRIIHGCGVLPYATGRISQACRLFAARSMRLMVLCSAAFLIAPAAHANELTSNNVGASAKTAACGRWSGPDASKAVPNLIVSMADLSRFEPTGSINSSTAKPSAYQQTNLPGRGFNNQGYRSTLPLVAPISLTETNYLHWESRLAGTRALVGVNTNGVRPLAEVSYAGWHLPITLYVPSRN
jgi:hypothetical protein